MHGINSVNHVLIHHCCSYIRALSLILSNHMLISSGSPFHFACQFSFVVFANIDIYEHKSNI